MTNEDVVQWLEEAAKLMELHDENPFKIKSYKNAAFKLDKYREPLQGKSPSELELIDGIGKSLSHKIHELLTSGHFSELETLRKKTPAGVRAMLQIKGLGPKKVAQLWHELEIESPGELLYACNENRLVELKGFGAKTQEQIRKYIEFSIRNAGYFLYAEGARAAAKFTKAVTALPQDIRLSPAGAYRRRCETLTGIDLILKRDEYQKLRESSETMKAIGYETIESTDEKMTLHSEEGIPFTVHAAEEETFAFDCWRLTGSDTHYEAVLLRSDLATLKLQADEHSIYHKAGLVYIEPELREGIHEIERALAGTIPNKLVELADLKGILHNHTTYSDGIHTLEEMALACRDAGYAYLGICDHSRSAAYAGGLSIERVLAQHAEIEKWNAQLSPFRIFKGIESDILADGSLDYPEEVLALFDLVVASVHSGLRMDEEKATRRLLKAIENPYTSILGHPSGRLLLSREAYPLNYPTIIDACAANEVAIELNANPWRLDLDWRWIEYALEKGVKIAINPDAHSIEGYGDLYYGICTARKGYLTAESTLNAMSLPQFENWLKERTKKKT